MKFLMVRVRGYEIIPTPVNISKRDNIKKLIPCLERDLELPADFLRLPTYAPQVDMLLTMRIPNKWKRRMKI